MLKNSTNNGTARVKSKEIVGYKIQCNVIGVFKVILRPRFQ